MDTKIDKQRIEAAVKEILIAIGEDVERKDFLETPARVARMYEEIFAGLHMDPSEHLLKQFSADKHDEMVIVKDIPFYSMCEHHLMPLLRCRSCCLYTGSKWCHYRAFQDCPYCGRLCQTPSTSGAADLSDCRWHYG